LCCGNKRVFWYWAAYSWVEYASKTKEPPPDSIRTIECRLLLGTLRTSTVSRPYCARF